MLDCLRILARNILRRAYPRRAQDTSCPSVSRRVQRSFVPNSPTGRTFAGRGIFVEAVRRKQHVSRVGAPGMSDYKGVLCHPASLARSHDAVVLSSLPIYRQAAHSLAVATTFVLNSSVSTLAPVNPVFSPCSIISLLRCDKHDEAHLHRQRSPSLDGFCQRRLGQP